MPLGTVPFLFARTGAEDGQVRLGGSDDDQELDGQRGFEPPHRAVVGGFARHGALPPSAPSGRYSARALGPATGRGPVPRGNRCVRVGERRVSRVDGHHRRCAHARNHPRAPHRSLRARAPGAHRHYRAAELPAPGTGGADRGRGLPGELPDGPVLGAVHPHRENGRARTPRRRARHPPSWRPGRHAPDAHRAPSARDRARARPRRHRPQCPAHRGHAAAGLRQRWFNNATAG